MPNDFESPEPLIVIENMDDRRILEGDSPQEESKSSFNYVGTVWQNNLHGVGGGYLQHKRTNSMDLKKPPEEFFPM